MIYGMPTLLELKTLDENVSLCRELGLAFVEFNMNLPQYQIDRIDERHLLELADKNGIFYTVHLAAETDVCHFNKKVSAVWADTVLDAVSLAKRLLIPVLNMHFSRGDRFSMPDRKIYLYEEYLPDFLKNLSDFRDKCEKAVGSSDIKICIENTSGFNLPFLRKGLEVLLESPVFGLTFDTGHNHRAGGQDGDFILERKDKLRHLHLHESTIRNDHLPFGEGEIGIEKVFRDFSEFPDLTAVVEVKTVDGLKKSVEWLRELSYFP